MDNSTTEGVVLVSLGTHMYAIDMDVAMMLASGLAKLQQRVLWHYKGNASALPLGNNTKVVTWIPLQGFMGE